MFKKTRKTIFLLVAVLLFMAERLYAGENFPHEISWLFLVIGLFGGLAFFLFGIEMMSEGMKKTAGDKMRSLLTSVTKNRVIALFVGTFITMVIQSSSATTVMLVSFVQAGLMSFYQTMGVIIGGGIGTTITAQLIAFKLTDFALLMVAVGFGLRMFSKHEYMRNLGEVLLGFGILFYGMKLMSDSMKPLRTYPAFLQMLKGLENPVMGLMVGTLFTALIQSSSAFTGILIVLAQQGLITLEAGIPMIFGANIGTCITAGLASIGTGREAKRVALAHVLFKVAGVLLFIFWIPQFADLIRGIDAYFNAGTARQIANAHTIFNVGLGIVFLPLISFFGKIIIKILPDRQEEKDLTVTAWHLDEKKVKTPAIAIDLARTEISRVAKILGRMQRAIIVPFLSDEPRRDEYIPQLSLIEGIELREKKINFLQEKIKDYLLKVSRRWLTEKQSSEVFGMIAIVKDMESLGDIIHRNMIPMIPKKQALNADFSEEGREELLIYHEKVCKQISLLEEAFAETNLEKARKIMASERKFLDLESKYRLRHIERLKHKKKETIETHEVHLELMDLMKQIIVYSSNIAKTFLTTCGQQNLV